jgi:hypothetical protein
MNVDLTDYISDYTGSTHYALLADEAKEHAEALLGVALQQAAQLGDDFPAQADAALFERVLCEHVARLDLPLEARRAAPGVLAGFFDYLGASGRYPAASEWTGWMAEIGPRYAVRLREDGSVRGQTVRRNLPAVGRNDPCPCGSGLKFKKCCMGLLT